MSDPRLTPATSGAPQGQAQVVVPLTDLRRSPGGARDRQLRLGMAVAVYERRDGWAYVQSQTDGYVGYLRAEHLGEAPAPTHRVAVPASHAYEAAKIQAPELMALSFDSRVAVLDEGRAFCETNLGFIPKAHLRALDRPFSDPVTVAQLFFGVPYLWGGNSVWGIDCSGLVQMGCLAAGIACPGDSDMQEAALGTPLAPDAPLARGDVIFWKGHVGLMVDEVTLLHATGHSMSTRYEPLEHAVARIELHDGTPVRARRRL